MRDYDATVKNLREAAKGLLFDAMPYRASVMKDAADAIEELLDELTTIRKQLPHWISVEERLPEKYESVITASKNGDVHWNYLINVKYGTWSNGYHITHWMPLPKAPEPPKGVE